jgi:hypothetical protein
MKDFNQLETYFNLPELIKEIKQMQIKSHQNKQLHQNTDNSD